jgi:hypothetical protein
VIDRQPTRAVGSEPEVQTLSVMGNYFGIMQIPMRAGRDRSAVAAKDNREWRSSTKRWCGNFFVARGQ